MSDHYTAPDDASDAAAFSGDFARAKADYLSDQQREALAIKLAEAAAVLGLELAANFFLSPAGASAVATLVQLVRASAAPPTTPAAKA